MLSFSAHYVPKVIHENEHITAVVFGRHKEEGGLLTSNESLLVATDKRIIYLDHKPGFTTLDEVSYDIVTGVRVSEAGLRASITLFTKINNYTISFARTTSVEAFAQYIESQRIDTSLAKVKTTPLPPRITNKATIDFLKSHDIAIPSTVDRTGNITAAAVYYVFKDNFIYIITKESTKKSRNMFVNQQVAITIYDAHKLQLVQIKGFAEIENDTNKSNLSYQLLTKPRQLADGEHQVPVAKINGGRFIVFRISPIDTVFSDFS